MFKYLTEITDIHTSPYINVITRDCKPFIRQMSGIENVFNTPLYRGTKQIISSITKFNARLTDRNPRNTSVTVHNYANQLFQEQFGYPFRNGVFATSSFERAKFYGNVYQFVPIGEFEFCWSPTESDFVGGMFHMNKHYLYNPDQEISTEHKQQIQNKIKDYRVVDLHGAINSTYEIMFWCEQYYLIPL